MMLRGIHKNDGSDIRGGLATIHPDGTELLDVTDGTGIEHQPDWIAAPC